MLFCLLFFTASWNTSNTYPNKSVLFDLSSSERDDLKLLFHDLFAANELGYTLFGDKPMSFCTPNAYHPKISKRDFLFRLNVDNSRPLFKGLAAWRKIEKKINSEKYLLIFFHEKQHPNFAILINKPAFNYIVQKNLDLFKKSYGNNVSSDLILSDLQTKKSYAELQKTPLFHNDTLLGIALGYGRHNAELFNRREELTYQVFPQPKFPFNTINEELDYLWSHLQLTSTTDNSLLLVTQVAFAGDPDDLETNHFIKNYCITHEHLSSIFNQVDWLERILNELGS